MYKNQKIAVVIPAFKCSKHILKVIENIPNWVDNIFVVDDKCPEGTGLLVSNHEWKSCVNVIFHEENSGVGAAMLSGYKNALKSGADIVVKMDGDDQMESKYLTTLINPIILEKADYTKGNRFFSVESLSGMPKVRLMGNAMLSLLNKISTGYWNIFDPTNGFTAINSRILERLPLDKINKRYFFESDLLFRLSISRAVVRDIDIPAKYSDERSNLKIFRVIPEFFVRHILNSFKRFLYNYLIRDVSVASIQLPLGLLLFSIGFAKGLITWKHSAVFHVEASVGTVVLTSVLLLSGIQFILAFLAYDISNVPRK